MMQLWTALERHSLERPHSLALVDPRQRLSYRELRDRVESLAATLRSHGCARVGLLAPNGVSWVLANLAAARAGCCVAPLPTFFTTAQRRHIAETAQLDAVIATQLLTVDVGCSTVHALGGELTLTTLGREPRPAPWQTITYTSGSTGAPKGVCLRGATMMAVLESLAEATDYDGRDRHACVLPLSTLLETIAGVYLPLSRGALVCLDARIPGVSGEARDAARLAALLRQWMPSTAIVTPALLRLLVAQKGRPPRSLRFLAVGGAPVGRALVLAAQERGLPVYEGYGLSECASVVALNRAGANRPGSVGRPLAHVDLRLAPDGELLVRGACFDGYLQQAGPTLVDGYLPTGDLAHVDAAGYLHIHGRKRDIIITAYGRNIAPAWVEAALLAMPGVQAAWVYGDDANHLTAVVEALSPLVATAAVISANRELPAYAHIGQWLPFDGGARDRADVARRHLHGLDRAAPAAPDTLP